MADNQHAHGFLQLLPLQHIGVAVCEVEDTAWSELRFDQAHLHAHINLVGFASMVLFGLLYRAFPALAESKMAGIHFVLFNLGAIVFLAGIPLAQANQTVALAAGGSLLVLVAILTFLANYFLNVFSARGESAGLG
jgi:hypothetical protein